jgi:hypothetical protein
MIFKDVTAREDLIYMRERKIKFYGNIKFTLDQVRVSQYEDWLTISLS